MIDKQHSYCAKKLSVYSLPPTPKEIELILEMHNQERSDVNAKDMQKMVIGKKNSFDCKINIRLYY
jgi:hypothetical protein